MAVFSQASLQMRRFLYRQPRLKTNLSMDFIREDNVVLGICRSISESGVGGTLSHPVPVGSEGALTLYFQEQSVKVQAVIETSEPEETRIRFLALDPKDCEAVRHFIKLLSQSPQP